MTKFRIVLFIIICISVSSCRNKPLIVIPEKSSDLIILAGKEIRRYTYLRSGVVPELLKSNSDDSESKDQIIISPVNSEMVLSLKLDKYLTDNRKYRFRYSLRGIQVR